MSRKWINIFLVAAVTASCGYLGLEPGEDSVAAVAPPQLNSVEAADLAVFIAMIPPARAPDLDLEMALTLVAMPLSCLDRPQAAPRDRSTYLDEIVAARRPGYERNRSFYGCWDWHSAVNSVWAMVKIHKEYPSLPIRGLVREKLNDHLSVRALEGELEYFQTAGGFERPYGYAWLLKLYAELRTWDDPDAIAWADNLEPLATLFSERMVAHLADLERPSRSGAHSNTAFALAMMLDYARTLDDQALDEAIHESSQRLFLNDYGCPTAYEPWGSDFLSPCLEEAALMAEVLEPAEFLAWFGSFMAPVNEREFLPLTMPVDTSEEPIDADPIDPDPIDADPIDADPVGPAALGEQTGTGAADIEPRGPVGGEAEDDEEGGDENPAAEEEQRRIDEERRALGAKSHLIGLAFIRADAMIRIAAALPAGDPRIEAYQKLATLHGAMGFDAMFDADYAGSHWIGTFALKYLLAERAEW